MYQVGQKNWSRDHIRCRLDNCVNMLTLITPVVGGRGGEVQSAATVKDNSQIDCKWVIQPIQPFGEGA